MSMDTGTSSVDKGTSGPPTPNRILLELRKSRGWGRPRLAKELHRYCQARQWPSPGEENLKKQIYRLESGQVRSPDEFYSRLYCRFFDRSSHDLFGDVSPDADPSLTFNLASHKFVPVFIGAEAAKKLVAATQASSAPGQWIDCHRASTANEACTMYAWPFGVVVYHLVEELSPTSVAEVSVWRRTSYPENIEWATHQLAAYLEDNLSSDPYVLSAYWVKSTPHDGARLDTLLRLLSIPRVLLNREEGQGVTPSRAHAELVEQSLLKEGFDHPEIVDFGMKGISFGYASWSGVVYHPIAPTRALTEHELVSFELSAQAAWSYCNFIRSEVERGRDPVVPDEYGWRFVRGLRSKLAVERPQETSQHRTMREAIMETSGLSRHLSDAVETLREADGGRG